MKLYVNLIVKSDECYKITLVEILCIDENDIYEPEEKIKSFVKNLVFDGELKKLEFSQMAYGLEGLCISHCCDDVNCIM